MFDIFKKAYASYKMRKNTQKEHLERSLNEHGIPFDYHAQILMKLGVFLDALPRCEPQLLFLLKHSIP